MKVKLIVCCHKESARGDDLVVTVKAGAALGREEVVCDFSDDEGENISEKNARYNELTVLYWAWKNPALLGDPDVIGLMHYRRYFLLDEKVKDAVLRTDAPEDLFREKACIDAERAEALLSKGDFICPRPVRRSSVYKQYARSHKREDLDAATDILKRLFPDYADTAEEYLDGKECFFFNMFVFPKEIFLRYCAFIFPILEAFERERGERGRLYVSERLTGIFIRKLIKEGKSPVFLPVLCREEGRLRAFRKAWKESGSIKEKAIAVLRLMIRRPREGRRI